MQTEILLPPQPRGALLHFHGGGHTQPMNDMYRRIALRYAKLTGRAVFSPCYTAGEGKTYPSVHDECFAAYRAFAARCGMENTVAAGDSFGANLLLSACLLLVGVVMVLNPFGTVELAVGFFGLCLFLDGLLDILLLLRLR